MKIKIAIIFLVFTLLFSLVSATNVFDITLTSPITYQTAIVIAIALVLVAMGFIVARVFMIQAWEAWLRQEFTTIIFSGVLLVLFIGFNGVIETSANQLSMDILSSTITSATAAGKTVNVTYWKFNSNNGRWYQDSSPWNANTCESPCYFYIARAFLGSTYEKYVKMIVRDSPSGGLLPSKYKGLAPFYADSLLYESVGLGAGVDIRIATFTLAFRFSYPGFAGRAIFNNTLEMVVNLMLKALGSLKAQEMVLFTFQNLGGILFAAGIIFRVPWFTRKLGGLLVACAIGIYLIYPLVYVMGWYVVDRSTIDLDITINPPDTSVADFFSPQGSTENLANILFTDYTTNKIGLLDIVGRVYIPTLMIPVLAIFVTIGFIRHFSPMIGGDTEIAGLTHMI